MSDVDIVLEIATKGVDDIYKLSNAMQQLDKVLRGVANPMKALDARSRALSAAVGSADSSLKAHAKTIGQLSRNNSVLSNELGRVRKEISSMGTDFRYASNASSSFRKTAISDLKAYENSLKKIRMGALAEDLRGVAQEQKRLGKDAQFVGRSLIIGLTTPIVAFGRYGLQALVGVDAVMHFAGKSLVGESVEKPDLYHQVNVDGTRNLLDEMHKSGVKKLVFSSSAATYGEPEQVPILESAPTKPTNPYGATKLAIDQMITAESAARGIAAASLRYFNVAGALKSKRGWLAERHNPETHLIPNVLRSTKENPVKIFGTDWPTADGTCIRDYVHVVDLIEAHLKALNSLGNPGHEIYNLGSGSGYSVREVVAAASAAIGHQIPFVDSPRRAGDPAVLIADISKAKSRLDWQPSRDLNTMVSDTLKSMG